jgi:hypothetical protein
LASCQDVKDDKERLILSLLGGSGTLFVSQDQKSLVILIPNLKVKILKRNPKVVKVSIFMADHKFSLIYSKGFIGDIKKLTWARVRHNKKVVYRYKNK